MRVIRRGIGFTFVAIGMLAAPAGASATLTFSNVPSATEVRKVPLGRERAGFYELKLASKYENGPKQKTEINIQRCGVPDG